MSRTVAILMCLATLVYAPGAYAQDDEDVAVQVEQLSGEGAAAFKERDFEVAIDRFEKAYALAKVPLLLYNIGRCYEEQENWDKAIEYYKKYAVAPDVATQEREEALERVAKIEAARGKKDIIRDPDPDPKPASGPGALAYILTGTGAAALAAGGVVGFLALGEQTRFQDATDPDEQAAARESGQMLALTADGLFVGGGVLTIIGLIMILTAPGEETQQTTWAPMVAPDRIGAQMMWRF